MTGALIVTFSLMNRFWGAELPGIFSRYQRKFCFLFTIAASVAIACVYGHHYAWLPWVWFVHRSLAFDTFGGALDPTTPREIFGTLLRFSTPIPLVELWALLFKPSMMDFDFLVFAWVAATCTLISMWYGHVLKSKTPTWDYNIVVELLHGAVFGAGIATLITHS